jgi:hypothetical protein
MISNNQETLIEQRPVQRELACRYVGLEPLIARAMLSMDTHDPDPIDTLDVEGAGVATSEVRVPRKEQTQLT